MTVDNLENAEESFVNALEAELLAVADDDHVMGNRLCDWTGVAPTVEEDVAISNVAQDELGHAELFYDQVAEIREGSSQELAYERSPEEYRNARLLEAPFEDWADTVVRHYCYDVADAVRLRALADGEYEPIEGVAQKVLDEEAYHTEHGEVWIETLAADVEGRERLVAALEDAWADALAFFEPAGEVDPAEAGVYGRPLDAQREAFVERAGSTFESVGLSVPDVDPAAETGREGAHSDDLEELLAETREVYEQGVDVGA